MDRFKWVFEAIGAISLAMLMFLMTCTNDRISAVENATTDLNTREAVVESKLEGIAEDLKEIKKDVKSLLSAR